MAVEDPHIHYPQTIEEAISDLETFLEVDMWYAVHNEWKDQRDMIKYLRVHFGILEKQIKKIKTVERLKNG